MEMYQKFWEVMEVHFITMSTHVFERGSFLPSQGRVALRLVPKNEKPIEMSDYRTISVLNVDYKLISSVLERRH